MMISKLMGTLMLSMASCQPTTYIQYPNRAVEVEEYQIVNATPATVLVDYYPEDATVTVQPNSTAYIDHETSGTLNLYTNTKFDGYCFFAPDSEDLVTITWRAISGTYSWMATIADYEPATGIGLYNRKLLPTNQDFYIDQNKLGIYSPESTIAMSNEGISLLPTNTTARIYKENGTYQSLADLRLWRYKTKTNVVAACIWTEISGLPTIVAQNFYVPTINAYANYKDFCTQADKSNSVSPQLMYWQSASSDHSPYTNKIRFTSGYYPFVPNNVGYADPYYLTSEDTGYLAIVNDGSTAESSTFEVLTKTMDLIAMAMTTAVGFLGYMVFPGITIGFLVLLPLIISLLVVLLKMVKKG